MGGLYVPIPQNESTLLQRIKSLKNNDIFLPVIQCLFCYIADY